ncbi:MAG TPA: glycosyltransferase family 2 protein [Terriglobales bacterium]|nr:glycosyltransferase family 2 protein [Terriglobales bacterium]
MSKVSALTVSIVTPNMNMGRWLAQTMQSVLSNVRPGDQYLVIDGESKDDSVEIIRGFEKHLTGWVSEPDEGYADALAKGFARATGDMLCWINAGDLLLPGALDAARLALTETDSEMVFGDDLYLDEEGRVIFFSRGYVKDLHSAMLYGGWTPLQDACFWRRDLYERVGGINPSLRYAADFDLFFRMALHGRCRYVPLTFSGFRRHAGQKSIVGSDAYQRERVNLRRAVLDRLPGSHLERSLRRLWHGAAIRWRVHVSQRRWRRPDLVGQPVEKLHCAQYWPPVNTV